MSTYRTNPRTFNHLKFKEFRLGNPKAAAHAAVHLQCCSP